MEKKEEFCRVLCVECGFVFQIPEEIQKSWRQSGKIFYCPNGHNLTYPKPKDPDKDAEIGELKTKVEDLEKKCKALEEELEIWRPIRVEGT